MSSQSVFDFMPDLETVILPSLAVLRSWRDQTVPARKAALSDSLSLYRAATDESSSEEYVDMAALAVVADAMQPLEDLAYFASSWTSPFSGFASYVRATTYSGRTPTNFWQKALMPSDADIDLLAGFAAHDPRKGHIVGLLEMLEPVVSWTSEQAALLDKAKQLSRPRIRATLQSLGQDWRAFSPYFHAFKHGGLALSRTGTAYLGDDAEEAANAPQTITTALAVWPRRTDAESIVAEIGRSRDDMVLAAGASGTIAIEIVDRMVASKLAVTDAIEVDETGTSITEVGSIRLLWTHWLAEEDLTREEWEQIGPGPTLNWVPLGAATCSGPGVAVGAAVLSSTTHQSGTAPPLGPRLD
jgi:hypothetical protein